MKKKLLFPFATIFLLWGIFFQISCKDSFFDYDFDLSDELSDSISVSPTFIAPLIHGKLSLEDLLTDSTSKYLQIDADKFMHIKYDSLYRRFLISDFVNTIPKQDSMVYVYTTHDQNDTNKIFLGALNNLDYVDMESESVYRFRTKDPNQQIDSIIFEAGTLYINVDCDFKYFGKITFTFPTVTKPNGDTLSFEVNLDSTQAGQSQHIALPATSLEGLKIGLFDKTENVANRLHVTAKLHIKKGQTENITTSQTMRYTIKADNFKVDAFWGSVGQQIYNFAPARVNINLTQKVMDGNLFLKDPKITLHLASQWMMPNAFILNDFSIFQKDESRIDIGGHFTTNWTLIESASKVGQTKVTDIVFDNSTIPPIGRLLLTAPKYLIMSGSVKTNPYDATAKNYIPLNAPLDMWINIDIPLDLALENYVLADTLDLNMDSLIFQQKYVGNLNWLVLKTFLENGFPVAIKTQAYFTDENFNVIDSLFSTPLSVEPAPVNNIGRVTDLKRNNIEVKKEKSVIDKLKPVKKVIFQSRFDAGKFPTETVRFYSDYKVGVSMGIKVNFNASTKN